MIKQVKQCKGEDSDYVEERCTKCGKRMTNVKYIYYDLHSGNYVCKTCDNKYSLNAVPCDSLD